MIVRQLNPWSSGWNTPGNALARMRRDMETLMERLTGESADGSVAGVFPPMNVSEDLSGTRQSPEEEGVSYHRKERAEGPFSRSVTLPASFDGARIDAKYIDGILTLTLPKPEAAKPRRVTVQTS
jgi:HSP20 family protein